MNSTITLFALAVLLIGASAIDITIRKDCSPDGSIGEGAIKKLRVEPCEREPCEAKRGEEMTLTVDFESGAASNTLTGIVYGIVAGVPAPFPLPNPDGCRSVGCPVEKGGQYTYTETLKVERYYPKISVTVKWQLFGDNDQELWCFTIPIIVVD